MTLHRRLYSEARTLFGVLWRVLRGGARGPEEPPPVEVAPVLVAWDLNALTERVKEHEGFRGTAYIDTTGNQTIGYGRNLDANPITKPEAEQWLRRNLVECSWIAKEYAGEAWRDMGQHRREVLIEMAYNLGKRGLYGFRAMRRAIRARDYREAARQMENSKWRQQVKLRALTLAEIMRTGEAL